MADNASTTTLLFGIHCHQPVDNFSNVVHHAIERSYRPFFNVLKDFPDFKLSVHFSGWLLEFIQKNDPELFELMQRLSPQIEFFSGGYYEPVLASIPSVDRIAQIKKLNRYIKKHFHQQPKGLWLTERVWEDSIIPDIKACGIEYVVVDDYHFIAGGAAKENLKGYFITENGGEKVGLFPINKALRYAIPFVDVAGTKELLYDFAGESGNNAAIIFDDGEKFGIWPKTYDNVYEREWLKEFLETVVRDEKIETATFNEYFKESTPVSLAYLPTVSYAEMGEWSMGAEQTTRLHHLMQEHPGCEAFIKGGIWKNFLTKYQESNWIHKRVLELSKKQKDTRQYRESLYKAECNDVLWHGVFGGIYLPNLRDNAYRYIIKCEEQLGCKNDHLDITLDGYTEYKFHADELLAIICVKHGGQIFELDIMSCYFNLQNTMTRYKEAYHANIEVCDEEEPCDTDLATIHDNRLMVDEEVALEYDWYLKKSAIDHITDRHFDLNSFKSCLFTEYGDFANQPFDVVKKSKNGLSLQREGGLFIHDTKEEALLEKRYRFKKSALSLQLRLTRQNNDALHYVNEWNLHFADVEQVRFNGLVLEKEGLHLTGKSVKIEDPFLNKTMIFGFDRPIDCYIVPIQSLSQSESGVDLTLQGVSFAFVYDLNQVLETSITFKVASL
jgi:hypothetical protein